MSREKLIKLTQDQYNKLELSMMLLGGFVGFIIGILVFIIVYVICNM